MKIRNGALEHFDSKTQKENEIKKSLEIYLSKKTQELHEIKIKSENDVKKLNEELERISNIKEIIENAKQETKSINIQMEELQCGIEEKEKLSKEIVEKTCQIENQNLDLNVNLSQKIRILSTLKQENQQILDSIKTTKESIDMKILERNSKMKTLEENISQFRDENLKKKKEKENLTKNISQLKVSDIETKRQAKHWRIGN
jgi:chromosome segregation ATPase